MEKRGYKSTFQPEQGTLKPTQRWKKIILGSSKLTDHFKLANNRSFHRKSAHSIRIQSNDKHRAINHTETELVEFVFSIFMTVLWIHKIVINVNRTSSPSLLTPPPPNR